MSDNTKRPVFLLIDGSSLLFRAFYAIRNLKTRDGIFTNGVYGFLNMYFKAVEMLSPQNVVVAFDRSAPTFRVKDYEAYKANRDETPSELRAQFGILKDVLDGLGVRHLDMDGYEADDIVGTLARRASESGYQSYLLTGDRDYFQLVDAHCDVLFTKKGINELEAVDVAWIYEKYGLEPKQLIDVKGLQGDASDNIPGVPGVGEKTAVKLIQQFGDMDGVYDHLEEISGKKIKENLAEYRAQAYLSKKLGTVYTQVPIEEELSAFARREPDRAALADRFERLEFFSFAQRFALPKAQQGSNAYEMNRVASPGWTSLAQALAQAQTLDFLVMGDQDNYLQARPLYLALRAEGETVGALIDIREDEAHFSACFAPVFGRAELLKRTYDVKEAICLLSRAGISLSGRYEDLMLMEYLLEPGRGGYELAGLAQHVLGKSIPSRLDILGKGVKKKSFQDVEEEKIQSYAGGVHVLDELASALREQLRERELEALYEEMEKPLAAVLAQMELTGFLADRTILSELDRDFSARLAALEQEIYDYAGGAFLIHSPKQLGEILFDRLKLPHGKKTKTGYSTSADVLEKLRDAHPLVDAVLNYRQLSKLKSTYVDGLLSYMDETGRIHSTFRQNVTATGRISSTEPNLQNIPVRTEEGRKLRKVFVAREGCVLVDADYSQIELRVLAALSGDEAMLRAFSEGADIHRKTAAEIGHIPMEEVTDEERSRAKAVNFGIIYGISDFGLARNTGISRSEAKEYIERYKATYPQIGEYMDNLVRQAKKDGYVQTYYGRRRDIPELSSGNFNVRSFGERIALNTPIQGTAADIIKIAMVRVDQALRAGGFQARLILQVHDELIVEAPKEEAEAVGKCIVEIMEHAANFPVRLRADMNMGRSWYDAK
ncbi:MAG: DNA polymerase I [Ndongobacter sp.]|nr:DNA polymerase I [Ndongobacter sp.]